MPRPAITGFPEAAATAKLSWVRWDLPGGGAAAGGDALPVEFDLAEGRVRTHYAAPRTPTYQERQQALKTLFGSVETTGGFWTSSWMGCSERFDTDRPFRLVFRDKKTGAASFLRWDSLR